MREIKFRGKRVDNGEWVVGGFTLDAAGEPRITTVTDDKEGLVFNKVIPETVGQFTGKQDRNSSDVFDGDIVKPQTTKLYTPTKEEIGAVYWDDKEAGFMIHWLDDDSRLGISEFFRGVEIIGNRFENPELLK